MENIKLVIAYDGGAYFGWQKNPMRPSIEESLQKCIEQILQHPTPLQAASRTDAGVHAQGQVVNFFTSKTGFDLHQFQYSLHCLLPRDISLLSAERMPLAFHPTIDCTSKEYRYFICLGSIQLPQHRFFSWHVPSLLNLQNIQEALPHLIGIHDFASFCNMKKDLRYSDTIREVKRLELEVMDASRLCIRIQGKSFLYKMVRNIIGTLIDIGKGKFHSDELPRIIESRHRPKAGVSAPAHGLFLHQVFY
jgi:tRNA pseudouridine38-40 synthase